MVRAVLRTAVSIGVLIAAILGTAGTAHATPQDIFGFGARSPGLGFTGVSYANDYEAVFLNPSGLARARTDGLWVGLSAGTFQLKIDGNRYPADSSRGMTIGFTLPLPFGDVLEDRLVLGGGFFTPSEVLLASTINVPQTPQFNVLERTQAAGIMVGFGFDFHDWIDGLRIGASVSVAADVIGNLVVFLDETNAFSSVVETQLVTAYAPIFGASYDHDNWGLGLTYRMALQGVMDLSISAHDLPIDIPDFHVGGTVHYDPAALAAEGYYRPVDDLRIALQLQTRFWDAYPGPQRQVTDTSGQPPNLGYSITVSPRVSGEWTFLHEHGLSGDLRLGYAFEPSPAGPARMVDKLDASGNPTGMQVALRYLDNHRHVATLGLGFRYEFADDMWLHFDIFGQLHVLMNRTHDIGLTDGGPPMQTGGTMVAGGWVLGLTY